MRINADSKSVWQIVRERLARFNRAVADADADEMIFQPRPQGGPRVDDIDDVNETDGASENEKPSPSASLEIPRPRRADRVRGHDLRASANAASGANRMASLREQSQMDRAFRDPIPAAA